MSLVENYFVPVSINAISGPNLEFQRQDTWAEAARQIQERSSFHPEHQIIQIIRFQDNHEVLILPNEPMSNLINGRANYRLIIYDALGFDQHSSLSHKFDIIKTTQFEIATDPRPTIQRLTAESRPFFQHLCENFLRTEMDRRRAHEAFLDARMYAIHGEHSVLENPSKIGSQFKDLRLPLGDRYLIQGYIDVFTSVPMDFRFYQPNYYNIIDHLDDIANLAFDDDRLPDAVHSYFNVI